MKYNFPIIKSFYGNIDEKKAIYLIKKEISKMKPPNYGGPGILICSGHIGESTFGNLIILDDYEHYIKMPNWSSNIYPMMMIQWIVHENLHKIQNQKGLSTLFRYVQSNKIKNNFHDFKKYIHDKHELYTTITSHYFVCTYTYLWMKKHYGEKYLNIIDKIWIPYTKFEKYIRKNIDIILKILLKLKLEPNDIQNYL